MPGKAYATSVSGSRLAIATPFHCEKPCASTWKPGVFELLERELLGLALDLLHRQHVDGLAHGEVDDPVDAGTDGVDVPRGKTHDDKPTATRRRLCVTTG